VAADLGVVGVAAQAVAGDRGVGVAGGQRLRHQVLLVLRVAQAGAHAELVAEGVVGGAGHGPGGVALIRAERRAGPRAARGRRVVGVAAEAVGLVEVVDAGLPGQRRVALGLDAELLRDLFVVADGAGGFRRERDGAGAAAGGQEGGAVAA